MDNSNRKRILKVSIEGLKQYELNSLEHEASKLFVPFVREEDYLCYDVTNLISICDLFGKNPPTDLYVKVASELKNAILTAEEYLLSVENLCLDPDTIFWNEATEKIFLLYAHCDAGEEDEAEDRFRIWAISLWHRSVALDWLNEDSIMAIHLMSVCLFADGELIASLSRFIERMNLRKELQTRRQIAEEQSAKDEASKLPSKKIKGGRRTRNQFAKKPK